MPTADPLDSVLDGLDAPTLETASVDPLDTVLSELEPPEATDRLTLRSQAEPQEGMVRIPGTGVEIPQAAATLARVGIETAGDIGGMLAARRAPVNTATRAGRAGKLLLESGGAGVGAALGSLGAESVDPTTDESPFRRAAITGGISLLTDAVGSSLGAAVLSKFKGIGDLEPGGLEILSEFSGRGEALPTAGRMSTSRAIDVAETITESSIFGGKQVQERLRRAEALGQQEVDKLIGELLQGASKEDVSGFVSDLLDGQVDVFKQAGREMFERLDEAIQAEGSRALVNVSPLFLLKSKLEKQITPDKPGLIRAVGLLDDALALHADEGLVSELPFSTAQELRSAFIAVGQSDDPIVRGGKAGAKRMAKLLDTQMEAAGRSLEGPAFQIFREANAFWESGRQSLENQALLSVLKSNNSDAVISTIIRPGGTETLKKVRSALFGGLGDDVDVAGAETIIKRAKATLASSSSSPQAKEIAKRKINLANKGTRAWEQLQGQFLLDAINKADPNFGVSGRELFERQTAFNAKKVKSRLGEISDETLDVLFPSGDSRKRFEKYLRLVEFAQSPAGRNIPGGIFVQLGQAGAAVALFSMSGDLAGPATIIMGPAILSRMMNSDNFIKFLTIGLSSRAGKRLKRRAFQQFSTIAIREGARLIDSNGNEINQSRNPRLPPPSGPFAREENRR